MYGAQVQFNINKKNEKTTVLGGLMSFFVRFALVMYIVYLTYKVNSGNYDNLTTQFNFLNLYEIPPVLYKDAKFLSFYQLWK
jgi:hypothetical protein